MDQQTYQRWWALHVRAALGESLNKEERAAYEVGSQQLDQEEVFPGQVEAIRKARAALAALEAENTQLRDRSEKLKAEIAVLEAAF